MIKKNIPFICLPFLFLILSGFICGETNNIELMSTDGDYVRTQSFKGKVVVVSWWATWCKPCLQELKFLSKMKKKYNDALIVVAVSTDGPETISAVNTIIRSKRLDNLIVLIDREGSTNPLGQLPYSIYLNRDGLQCSEHSGFISGDEDSIEKKIKGLINEEKK